MKKVMSPFSRILMKSRGLLDSTLKTYEKISTT
jgi:hypothetical protein